MKTLYLVRHAKSSWQYEDVEDVDRPLKGRGIRDAHVISQWIDEELENPEFLLSSPATRALHTAMIFARNLNFPFNQIQVVPSLYMASVEELMHIIHALDDRYSRVMVFGHNPTITQFVNRCIEHRIDNVPTSGIACFSFPVNTWKDVEYSGELIYFDHPKKRKKGAL